ncbi:hypothetical protein PIROE2DRAFT_8550 [Piromyces sp. E2]|nr:hypothetical protein PIROE2DRAFT_8550 [Piromyces sp. E2]|eukprot:OUM64629.1 hypothetical protein PIROE2DRAFT_8550 [Piromyces sp. E2]
MVSLLEIGHFNPVTTCYPDYSKNRMRPVHDNIPNSQAIKQFAVKNPKKEENTSIIN